MLAPVDIAWRTNLTVLWHNTSPYYIVGVSIKILEDADYAIYPGSERFQICFNKICYNNFDKIKPKEKLSSNITIKCWNNNCYSMTIDESIYEIVTLGNLNY